MIHTFSLRGHNIVLDVNSGAIHLLDRVAYDLLKHLPEPFPETLDAAVYASLSGYARAEIDEAFAELQQLVRDEALFSPDTYGIYAEQMVESPVKAMCLNVSHDCNLRCEYCFAGKGDYDQGRMVMRLETGKAAIDFLLRHSGDRENLEVDFFGGEPLLNMEVVRGVVDYARSQETAYGKHFRFTITTNGVLLDDDTIDYINREMSNIVLSLDGRKAVNDRVRARVDGSGCYDRIVPRFQRLVERRGEKEYYVRGTFTRYNLDFSEDARALWDLGFDQISIEPVVSASTQPYALTEADLPAIFDEYDRLADLLLDAKQKGKGLNFFHFMLDLAQGPCVIKRLRGCGCGNEYLAVTPAGEIYPCHQFIGQPGWQMGSVHDGTLDLAVKKRFAKNSVYGKPDCMECWARFYCSGGCSANNMQYMGNIAKPLPLSCELEKKRLECAIALQAELAQTAWETETAEVSTT